MKISIVVASMNRSQEIAQLLERLAVQTLQPHAIVLSVPTENDLPPVVPPGVKTILGPKGLTLQRNRGLDMVLADCDVVMFYDDDFLPAKTSLAGVARIFADHPDIVSATGMVLVDGVRGGGISFETGMQAVLAFESNHPPPLEIIDYNGAYGCNMAFRAAAINDMRFDENLPLHGWQEDIDFSNRLAHRGRLVKTNAFVGVHRGVNKGRSPGVPLGFAQIVNPAYLVKKGAITPKKARQLMLRCFVANHLKSFRPEPEIDRRGRLRGNWYGIFHLLRGRSDPMTILTLK